MTRDEEREYPKKTKHVCPHPALLRFSIASGFIPDYGETEWSGRQPGPQIMPARRHLFPLP